MKRPARSWRYTPPVSAEITALIERLSTENHGRGCKRLQVSCSSSVTGRAYAFSQRRGLGHVTADVVARRLRFDENTG